ncbi:MAG: hypothetical protein ACW972_09115 [Promethearchaeota archaeon]|jgi:hypothetical protein
MLFRHGDVLISNIREIPQKAKKLNTSILVRGEITGHSHQIQDPYTAQLYQHNSDLYLEVLAPIAIIVHEEHNSIELSKGNYRIWSQREYTPKEVIQVRD